jgi:large subunit ribosomal protein L13
VCPARLLSQGSVSSPLPLRRPSTLVRLVNMLSIAAAAFAYNIAPVPAPHAVVPATAAARACRIAMEEGVASLPPTAAQKTWFPKSADTAKSAKKWFVVDAEGLRLGRMSSEVAKILLGKNKATYTPGADVGDAVVIVNAEKIIVTGNKRKDKLYRRHSGRPGGMKIESFEELQARVPERIVEKAIVGMLPKNSHGRELFRNLKVYAGPEHPHDAQSPEPLTFGGLTSTPDTQVLEYLDPDAPKCVN